MIPDTILLALGFAAPVELQAVFFGFGGIALAYLVLEELLTEAHEERRGAQFAGLLFAAFIVVFAAGLIVQ